MVIDARAALDDSVATLTSADDQIHRSHNLELLEAILAIAFLTGGLTATLRSRSAQSILLGVSVTVLDHCGGRPGGALVRRGTPRAFAISTALLGTAMLLAGCSSSGPTRAPPMRAAARCRARERSR